MSLMHKVKRYFLFFCAATVVILVIYSYSSWGMGHLHRHSGKSLTLTAAQQRIISAPKMYAGTLSKAGRGGDESSSGSSSSARAANSLSGSLGLVQSTRNTTSRSLNGMADDFGNNVPKENEEIRVGKRKAGALPAPESDPGGTSLRVHIQDHSSHDSQQSRIMFVKYNTSGTNDRTIDWNSVKKSVPASSNQQPSQNSLPLPEVGKGERPTKPDQARTDYHPSHGESLSIPEVLNGQRSSMNASFHNAKFRQLIDELEKHQSQLGQANGQNFQIPALKLVNGVNKSALINNHDSGVNATTRTKSLMHNKTNVVNTDVEVKTQTEGVRSVHLDLGSLNNSVNLNTKNVSLLNLNVILVGENEIERKSKTLITTSKDSGAVKTSKTLSDTLGRSDRCEHCFHVTFPTLIDHESYCSDLSAHTIVLLLITSAPPNQDKRQVIRQTWGGQCQDKASRYRCLFVIGLSSMPKQNDMVRKESEGFKDILQFSFRDAYSNLTYKTLSSLRWVIENCDQVDYVMKTDDDMYVNTNLIPVLLTAAPRDDFMGGYCWGPSTPHRDKHSKWYVPLTSYSQTRFPPMCSGTGYIMSRDVVKKVIAASEDIPFFHLEDVYVALCLQKYSIIPVRLAGFSNLFQGYSACQYRHQVMTSHEVPTRLLPKYWAEAQKCPGYTPSGQTLFKPMPLRSLA